VNFLYREVEHSSNKIIGILEGKYVLWGDGKHQLAQKIKLKDEKVTLEEI
jgi:hypothetical protein